MAKPGSFWNTERDAYLQQHYNRGALGSRQIGEYLGTTHSAVVGRARRLGLSEDMTLAKQRRSQATKRQRRQKPTAPPQPPKTTPPASAARTAARRSQPPMTAAPTMTSPWKTCQWIEADTKITADTPRCGCKTVHGSSWCSTHFPVVFARSRWIESDREAA